MLVQTDYPSKSKTSGGIELDIRPATPKDRAKILKFLEATDAPDLRFRFLSAVKASYSLAAMLSDVDHHSTEDLVAFTQQDGSVVATAMIARGSAPDRAEIAILVRSDLKGQGIGWEMLNQACEYARDQGYRHLDCIESSSNQRAISLEREQGFTSSLHPGDAELMVLTKELA